VLALTTCAWCEEVVVIVTMIKKALTGFDYLCEVRRGGGDGDDDEESTHRL